MVAGRFKIIIKSSQPDRSAFTVEVHVEDEWFWYGYNLDVQHAPYRAYSKQNFVLLEDLRRL